MTASQRSARRSSKAGMPPGSMVHIGQRRVETPRVSLAHYNASEYREQDISDLAASIPFLDKTATTWLNVDGIHQTEVVARIGEYLGLHPLLLEDLVNAAQRPKFENYGNCLFFVLKMLTYDPDGHSVDAEQVSIVLGADYVLSFQEGSSGDVFDPVRARLKAGGTRIRSGGADFLAYSLMDAIVDHYFVVLERFGDDFEALDEQLVNDPSSDTLNKIYQLKRQLVMVRRSIWPLREVVNALERDQTPLLRPEIHIYLRDLYDHTIQVIETVETMRDVIAGMLDIYLSSVSNRTNEIVKFLTIFGSIFIPLTFLAGVYGMNFHFMPELGLRWAYPGFWLITIVIISALLFYFRRKRWI
ncbi:MAG: magnesium/cobalt transporter CorA [Anaerolineae bacterium]|nr:magnesium/cobalt transporter CorA [Anaerolineae bacterium]MCB9140943.1 magnesium/cobalt transporter CorA [Anaerolineales bacterium]MCB0228139.1 magnesium/cobalt transporter CorA [Anaerolineae bacterium]MCB0235604.1 magnesium/cobalt transporter CorA [Anaerolineae bacterium]MCB0239264.1 magnesium/cobalt transporter CorA [Anaerolineae bacterium]